MRLAIFGSEGMLGSQVMREAQGHFDVVSARGVRIDDEFSLGTFISDYKPEVVINCAGKIPEYGSHSGVMIRSNSVGPQLLATRSRVYGFRLLHISTDCVFSGRSSDYWNQKSSHPDPDTVYGISKYLGEKLFEQPDDYERISVIRTSFVGIQHGLVKWAFEHKGKEVEGWDRAYWSGSTDRAVAKAIIEIADAPNTPLIHLATRQPITKYYLLNVLNKKYKFGLTIKRMSTPHINRALEPTFYLLPIEEALEEADWTL